ncbi:CDP-glycerol glycerophosphotransferase family protein [Weizmannia ginsengihumi]|nr:glycosyltransferase [Heyndrickxia ginsengihumi]MCM3023719.1 CDP-glycerol glycerophosphotransferase family protein [Heyndrickxia ginsengihumi]
MKVFNFFRKIKTAVLLFSKPFIKMYRNSHFRRIVKYTKFYKKLDINQNVILYEVFHGESMSDSPYAIFKHLLEDPQFNNYTHVWALNSIYGNLYVDRYMNLKNVKFVKVHSKQYLKYLASAKYLINNNTFPTYFQKKEGQIYVNTWHGTPLKTLGKEMRGEPGQYKNIQRNFLHSDFIFNPNKYTADILVRSHDLDGIYNGNIVVEGYPRVDLTLSSSMDYVKKLLTKVINIDFNKKIILYAPTWRGEVNIVRNSREKIYRTIVELKNKLPSDYQLLLKVHTLVYDEIKNDEYLKSMCIPNWIDTNELLTVVDILVTDYSSIFFDFLVTNRPIIFYMNDKEEYQLERGLYLAFNELPGPVCDDIDEVINAISNLSNYKEFYHVKYQEMLSKYCYKDDGEASKRVIDIIFRGKSTSNIYKVKNYKKNILMYCGGFLNNGITTSAINLLNNIDYDLYNVIVIEKGKLNDISKENFNRLNKNVKKIYRSGNMNITIKEYYKHNYILKKGLTNKKLHEYIPKDLYKREFTRIFGNVKFDIVIDFSGYVPFWSLLFSFGNFSRKIIYQHNDMLAEYHKIINNRYKHRSKMNIIFPIYKYFDKIVSVSKHTMNLNFKNLKKYTPNDKVAFVHNCIDPRKIFKQIDQKELFKNHFEKKGLQVNSIPLPEKRHINFVNMGRLSPEKDQEKLIRSFSKIAERYSNTRLYIIGEGILEYKLKQLSFDLGIDDKVIFTGQLTNPFYLMNRCDCFVLSSNHEGQPMVLLEALILGKPIIATNIAGARSILGDHYGELVENSENGLIYGMEKFINGGVINPLFNYEKYNEEALKMFYNEVCGEELSGENYSSEVKAVY